MSPAPFCTQIYWDIHEVLEGSFKLDHHPSSRAIRIYISSEYGGRSRNIAIAQMNVYFFCFFLDSAHERFCIVRDVFPALRSHCKSLGLQFYGVDMYSALPSSLCCSTDGGTPGDGTSNELYASREYGTLYQLERIGVLKLAVEEIKLCQRLSAGPNFVVSAPS